VNKIEALTLVLAALTLYVAFSQLRAANLALEANNVFLIHSTLSERLIEALDKLEAIDEDDTEQDIVNAFNGYQIALRNAFYLRERGGLSKEAWDDVLYDHCPLIDGVLDLLTYAKSVCENSKAGRISLEDLREIVAD